MKKKIKNILITGASKGIGFEAAKVFAALAGDSTFQIENIVLVARESAHFANAVSELKEISANNNNCNIVNYNLDVANRQGIIDLVADVAKNVGNIDVLVNNAGYTSPVPLNQIEFEDFEKTMAINLYAPFTFVQELLFKGNKFNTIVNIGSTAGVNGRAGWLTYSASKAAIINMSKVMREELSVYGTRVVCLSPGRTATDLRKTLAPDEDPTTIMQPQDVAQVIKIMCSHVGQFIDSENMIVRQ
ncbi:MAG: SDR family oxidoreductase [Candidatus Ancillula sp.]|jgi:3-oxoacyl-[acyl-carrier protein] reductase|nr:SDR family oxidoreductase [Candidatus Ancillula sp.]